MSGRVERYLDHLDEQTSVDGVRGRRIDQEV
jgi:hypothetical protein